MSEIADITRHERQSVNARSSSQQRIYGTFRLAPGALQRCRYFPAELRYRLGDIQPTHYRYDALL